jgi:subtilisin family serine protease
MKKLKFFLFVIIFSIFLTSCVSNIEKDNDYFEKETGIIWNEDINEIQEGLLNIGYLNKKDVLKVLNDLNLEIVVEIPQINVLGVKIDKPFNEYKEDFYQYFKSNPSLTESFRYIEPNYTREFLLPVSNDNLIIDESKTRSSDDPLSDYDLGKYLWGVRRVRAPEAWELGFTGDGVIVAVLDSGVNGSHPDLIENMFGHYDPVRDEKLDPKLDNSYYYHGSHVAGTIAANGPKLVGVAPDAKIIDIPIFQLSNNSLTFIGDIFAAKGMVEAVDMGASVLSNSWGGGGYSYALFEAIRYASENNVSVVSSSGNSHTAQIYYPSCYPGVITIGATEFSDNVTNFSSRGNSVTVVAPGDVVLSATGFNDESLFTFGGPYYFANGTSMAAPHVSGLIALLLQKHEGKDKINPYQVTQALIKGAVDIEEEGFDIKSGWGRIDAVETLNIPLSELDKGSGFKVELKASKKDPDGNDLFLEGVYVTLINKSPTVVENYYAKSNMNGLVEIPYIRSGKYEIMMGLADPWYSTLMKNEFRSRIQFGKRANFEVEDGDSIELEYVFEAHPKIVITRIDSKYGTDIILKNSKFIVEERLFSNPAFQINEMEIPERIISADNPLEILFDINDPAGWYQLNIDFKNILDEKILIRGFIEYNEQGTKRVFFVQEISQGEIGKNIIKIGNQSLFPVF